MAVPPVSELVEIYLNEEHVRFDRGVLDKYNVAGPRYTSYPTAPEWSDDFGPEALVEALEAESVAAPPLSLYVHLPFCEQLCLFCGCNVVITRDHAVVGPYVERLRRELETTGRHVARGRQVVQLHWGGGTPTYLTPDELEQVFEEIRTRFDFAEDAEIGIEIDPRVTTRDHVRRLRALGFNLISMGVQDFEPRVQAAVHRIQPYEETRRLFDECREAGFGSINVDLIYGLPYQTIEGFCRSVDRVIDMGADRVAMFSYAHVPWLKKQQGALARGLPEPFAKFELFRAGVERFTAAGYRFIGFDHFARPTDELCLAQEDRTLTRNFQGYSTKGGAHLLGFGVSAISSLERSYAQNQRDLPAYAAAVDRQGLATMRGMRLERDDEIRRDVITRLLCHCRIDKAEIEGRFGIEFDRYFAAEAPRLRDLESDGLVELSAAAIRVTTLGRLFLRVVGMAFDTYLRRQAPERPLFSKTI